jgi:hypothetical protein
VASRGDQWATIFDLSKVKSTTLTADGSEVWRDAPCPRESEGAQSRNRKDPR